MFVDVRGSSTFPTRAASQSFDEFVPGGVDDLHEEWPLHMGPCVQGMVCATYRACKIIETGCVLPFAIKASTVALEFPDEADMCSRCAGWHSKWMRRRAEAAFSLMSVLTAAVPVWTLLYIIKESLLTMHRYVWIRSIR